jgi:hypothetical protein
MEAVRESTKVWVSPVLSTKLLLEANEAVVAIVFSVLARVT